MWLFMEQNDIARCAVAQRPLGRPSGRSGSLWRMKCFSSQALRAPHEPGACAVTVRRRFPRPVHHRIPNFVNADLAAQRLADLPEFAAAQVVKVNPDTPQKPVRRRPGDHAAGPRGRGGWDSGVPGEAARLQVQGAQVLRGAQAAPPALQIATGA
jgi:hypothetical protein